MMSKVALRVVLALLISASAVRAQDQSVKDNGLQANRDYLSPEPFELIDTLNGNVVLTFTDLVLPGNAGRDLRFQRTYNSQVTDVNRQQWTFGLAGLPMHIRVRPPLLPGATLNDDLREMWQLTPLIEMSDGSTQKTTFVETPDTTDSSTMATTMRWVMTANFWKYDRSDRVLYLPDGTVAEYDSFLQLSRVVDPYGNEVTLAWAPGSLEVTQQLGNGEQPRVVTLTLDETTLLPTLMTFADRTWSYEYEALGTTCCKWLKRVAPPEGPAWVYEYYSSGLEAGKISHLVTPQGGEIDYVYTEQWFQVGPDPVNDRESLVVLSTRTSGGRAVTAGTWTLTYGISAGGIGYAVLTTPSDTRVTYNYDFVIQPGVDEFLAGGFSLASRIVQGPAPDDTELEREERDYTVLPVIDHGTKWWGTPELSSRSITRGTRTYTTEYEYAGSDFGDYHLPTLVTETGEQTRSTVRDYAHDTTPYILGQPTYEAVTVGLESFEKSWTYDPDTGFRTSETVYGMTSTFTADGRGNIATAKKANDKTMSYGYSRGVVNSIQTPEYTVTKTINEDGTVDSEMRGGRTTTFEYDDLSRLLSTQPPGPTNPITNEYDNAAGATIITRRGGSQVTTTVDGFGKPVSTMNNVGVATTTTYDAESRVTYQGYPFDAADIGTTIAYDGLGRIVLRTNPGGTHSDRTYGAGSVTLRDEEQRDSLQTWEAFGNPDEARLTAFVDADGKNWAYAYNTLGQLTSVTAQDGITRTWVYDVHGLLESETHPESGATTYQYDAAGVLARKTDANGTVFDYVYDGNDRVRAVTAAGRVTTISYEAGSDNRQLIATGQSSSEFVYDAAGRASGRTDTIDGISFGTTFQYDANDNLTAIFYPSLGGATNRRRVGYAYDAEHRINRVFDLQVTRDFANGFTYHPSGAVTAYAAGNGIANTFTYDPNRYWIKTIRSGALQLDYNQYDGVGNVGAIVDSRAGMNQTFTYDALDRLVGATGIYGSLGYAYNEHGNRQTFNGTSYTYQAGTLRLTAQAGVPFTYDDNGNLKTTPTATYAYNPQNLLESMTASGATTTYAYDADDWRVKKTTQGVTTYYFHGLHGELLTEWKSPGTSGETRDYVYAGSRLVSVIKRPWTESPNDIYGTIVPNGPPVTVTFATAGQRAYLTFEGVAGRRYALHGEKVSGTCLFFPLRILKPDGGTLWTVDTCGDTFLEPPALSASGTYTILVDPSQTNIGTARLTLYDVVNISAGSVVANGPPVTVTFTMPGQKATLTFEGIAGRRYALWGEKVSGGCLFFPLRILKPDGTQFWTVDTCGSPFLEPPVLPVSGTYSILVDPSLTAIGTARLTLYDVVDISAGSIVANGSSVTVTFTMPGQKATLTFEGIAGRRYALWGEKVSGDSCLFFPLRILKPDGTQFWTVDSCGSPFLEPPVLPVSGTYSILVDPSLTAIGAARLTLYDVVDLTGSVSLNGGGVGASLTTPGQVARFTMAGNTGQQVTVRLTGNTIGFTTVKLLKPDGVTVATASSSSSSFNLTTQTLPTTGTYTVVIDPSLTNMGDITVAVTSP